MKKITITITSYVVGPSVNAHLERCLAPGEEGDAPDALPPPLPSCESPFSLRATSNRATSSLRSSFSVSALVVLVMLVVEEGEEEGGEEEGREGREGRKEENVKGRKEG